MSALATEVAKYTAAGWATDTATAYGKYAFYFLRWVIWAGVGNLLRNYERMQNWVLPLYIAFIARTTVHSTIRTYLNGVRIVYETRGLLNPLADHFGITHMLQGVRRLKPGGTKQKLPITLALLHIIVSSCDLDTPAGAAIASACTIAFFAFLRKSNVTVGKQRQNNEFKNALTAGNIWVDYETYTLWIRLTCTKTIQFGERVLTIPIVGHPGSPIDPVRLWENHLNHSDLPRKANEPAFAYQKNRGGTWTNLTHATFVKHVKQAVRTAGLDSAKYAAHSFRRGGATFAAAAGASADMIKALGDWRSDAYQLYICVSETARHKAATLIAQWAHNAGG
jgi:hypothetical protein